MSNIPSKTLNTMAQDSRSRGVASESDSLLLAELNYCCEKGWLRPLDVEFARFLWSQVVTAHGSIPLADTVAKYSALVSHFVGKGHVCVRLDQVSFGGLAPWFVDDWLVEGGASSVVKLDAEQSSLQAMTLLPSDINVLAQATEVINSRTVLNTASDTSASMSNPLILEASLPTSNEQRLYLNRYWHYEQHVADFMTHDRANGKQVDEVVLRAVLDELFGVKSADIDKSTDDTTVDYQKLAAAIALTSNVSVITGGPGTGKTYTVVRILAALIQYCDAMTTQGEQGRYPIIRLAAPTGKAAARMLESIRASINELGLTEAQRAIFPDTASTLHRLLGSLPLNANFKHHQENPVHLDILIVDEASMIDLPMMAKLLDAIPHHARVVFLGDRDQLASVEAGAVLNDLCLSLGDYSANRAAQLTSLTGFEVPVSRTAKTGCIQDKLAWLKISRRFHQDSGIGQIAQLINSGDDAELISKLAQYQTNIDPTSDVNAVLLSTKAYAALLANVALEYHPYLSAAHQQEYSQALNAFLNIRVLCAVRDGDYGVAGLNQAIERLLVHQGKIRQQVSDAHGTAIESHWYVGRPVMVVRNDHSLGLYNGDIGIVMADEYQRLRVYFETAEGVLSVLPSRMPEHETAYAMTVHKSQGSEFTHTVLITPDRMNPVLTRELIYTGVTRAKQKLTLLYKPEVLSDAVKQRVVRFSGLAHKLKHG